MGPCVKFGAAGVIGLSTLAIAGLLSAQESGAGRGGREQVAPAPAVQLLIGHALGMAIDGTSTQLTARQIATLPERKKDQAKGALEALRKSARANDQDSAKLFAEAQKELGSNPGDAASRRFYDAAVAYTKTMWDLAGEAAPVTEKPDETGPTGELSIEDLAAVQVINGSVRGAVGAFLLKQLTLRAGAPGDDAVKTLRDHSGTMAEASKKASARFPKVPEESLKQAKAKLAAAKAEKGAAKAESEAAKAEKKQAKRLQSRAGTAAAKAAEEEAKQTKKQAGEAEKKAKKAQQKAEGAQKEEVGEDVRSSVEKLGHQGRDLILMLYRMTEGPGEAEKP
jgi:hypothetical protein